jgi:regulatory protein YycI of two-component signal transduction system YycFG
MFISALFMLSNLHNQPRYLSRENGYYLIVKNKEVALFAGNWMQLMITVTNQTRQVKKDKYMFPPICES